MTVGWFRKGRLVNYLFGGLLFCFVFCHNKFLNAIEKLGIFLQEFLNALTALAEFIIFKRKPAAGFLLKMINSARAVRALRNSCRKIPSFSIALRNLL